MENNQKQQQKQKASKKAVAKDAQILLINSPIYECLMPQDLFESGIGHIVISRKLENENILIAMFLLDIFCLGVKDAFIKEVSLAEYNNIVNTLEEDQTFNFVSPSYAYKLVENLVTYAKNLGFKPHSEYKKAQKIFEGIDINECKEEFFFGKDGKPFYINGPYDDANKIRKILGKLTDKLGTSGFNFTFVPSDMFDED